MSFRELRSSIRDIAPAVEQLVLEEGPQAMREVFRRLPAYIDFTAGDLRKSASRVNEAMWQTEVRNLSRNQNPSLRYQRYQPIAGCALVYEQGVFFLSGRNTAAATTEKVPSMSESKKVILRPLPTTVADLEAQRKVKRTYTLADEIESVLLVLFEDPEFHALLECEPSVNGSVFVDDVCAAQMIKAQGINDKKPQIRTANLAEICTKMRVALRRFDASRSQRAHAGFIAK